MIRTPIKCHQSFYACDSARTGVAKLAQLSRQFVINIDLSQAKMMVLLLVSDAFMIVVFVQDFAENDKSKI